jgi:hypothetical protein
MGCASTDTGNRRAPQAASGVVTWVASDIGRVVSSDDQRILWTYLITLRNAGDRAIQFESVERAVVSSSTDTIGGTPTREPFRRTLAAGSELRVPASDNWGWIQPANRTFGGAATLGAITAIRRFSGTDDRGTPIEVEVRIQLSPSVGVLARPPVMPRRVPTPTTLASAGDLATLVGSWRGSYRMDGTLLDVPIEVTILADGTFQVAESEPVTNRFTRTLRVKDGGLDYSGGRDRGTLTYHEIAGRRMLLGQVSQTNGRSYAIYLEAQEPTRAP